MGWLDRLFPTRAHALILLWRTQVIPAVLAEIEAWPEEKKAERAIMRTMLDRIDVHMVELTVVDSVAPPRVDKKPERLAVKA